MKARLLVLGSLGAAALGAAVALARGSEQAVDSAPAGDMCALFDHEHAAWTALLQRYVRDGNVDYAGWKRAGASGLAAYLGSLASVCGGHYDTWTRDQKLAFWLNAYNAYTVKLVLDHYPLASIRDIGLLPGAAFREEFIPAPAPFGTRLSLNFVEHRILRTELGEPRIHFAIVCASKSCPALRSEAYRASVLERQLDDATRAFVRDPRKNRYDAVSRTLYLSSIFDWFDDDFERAAGSVPAFVARYADEPVASAIRAGSERSERVRVKFLDYDWSLNGR